jgi:DNA-binding LytR/AlgR family response regulator
LDETVKYGMRQRNFDLLAIAGIFVCYSLTIRLALRLDLVDCLLGGIANTIPVVIFGAAVRHTVMRLLIGRSMVMQLAAHLLLCAAFVCLSYCLLIVLLGLFNGAGPDGFVVRPFSASGAAWQSLENVTTYALIATVSHSQAKAGPAATSPRDEAEPKARVGSDESATVAAAREALEDAERTQAPVAIAAADASESTSETRAGKGRSRYFVRIGEELRPIDIDAVVSIAGADDYAEVRTLSGKHLVRVTLAEFARSLDPAKYVRVHRSWIVNIHRIASAEPGGGGRLLLHMETGQTISTSRTGAKLLRDRVL